MPRSSSSWWSWRSRLAYVRAGSGVIVTQAVLTGLLIGGVYGLVAMGLTLIFGVLDIVNFAHGAFLAIALYITVVMVDDVGAHPLLALLVSVPLMFLLGWAVAALRPVRRDGQAAGEPAADHPRPRPAHRQRAAAVLRAQPEVGHAPGRPRRVDPRRRRRPVAAARLRRGARARRRCSTSCCSARGSGTAIRAVAANDTGAQLVGIDTRRIYAATFAIGTACAGAAGVLVAPLVTIEPTTGELFNIVAFVVVVLGGMGNVVGALVGGLLIGLTEQLGAIYLPGQSPLLSVFIVFVLVLFLRPQGLFGRAA